MRIIKRARADVHAATEDVGRGPSLALGGPVELGIPRRGGITWLDGEVLGPGDGPGGVVVAMASPSLPEAWPADRPSAVLAVCAADARYAVDVVVARTAGPVLALRPVGTWRRVQRRDDVRLPLLLTPISLTRGEGRGAVPVAARIRNVSAGGLALRTSEEVAPGEQLRCAFSLPGEPKPMEVGLEVRWARGYATPAAEHWIAGCAFHPRDRALAERIVRYIFAWQRALSGARRHPASV